MWRRCRGAGRGGHGAGGIRERAAGATVRRRGWRLGGERGREGEGEAATAMPLDGCCDFVGAEMRWSCAARERKAATGAGGVEWPVAVYSRHRPLCAGLVAVLSTFVAKHTRNWLLPGGSSVMARCRLPSGAMRSIPFFVLRHDAQFDCIFAGSDNENTVKATVLVLNW